MKYLLDTDTCIYALKQNQSIIGRLLAEARSDVVISVITEAELRTGAAKSSARAKTLQKLENFLKPIEILEFRTQDAIAYAQIRASLERAGIPIGPLDTLIAAQAMSRNLTLVSNNQREFRRISELSLENWYSES
ncbi:MAG: type II toxin-antitoxin system VapC family toxin [Vulcanimicrobiota bacterium]